MPEIEIKKIDNVRWEIPKSGAMKVPARIFASEKLLQQIKQDNSLVQIKNVATLPGIYKYAIALPDAHEGYGFPIGGVAALDFENGGISPGGIGYDINCGVRLLKTNLNKKQILENIHALLNSIFKNVPCGVGSSSSLKLNPTELDNVLNEGTRWAVKNGYGNEDDFEHCEENGSMKEANTNEVFNRAKQRGKDQLGTLGAGNHFLEIQYVDEIFDKKIAEKFGIFEKDQVTIMIHCGSRGLGHQVCTDYIREMEKQYHNIVATLPDRELIYAPSGSKLAEQYFSAMAASANYAWCNRHIIAHNIRKSFSEVLKTKEDEIKTVYDVAHNIAKVETHEIDGKKIKVYLHRKGGTRAFGPGRVEIPKAYRDYGQPIIIPGTMGTASYILVGTEQAMKETFGSTAHGSGRVMSRHAAKKQFWAETVKKDLEKRNIYVKAASYGGISEEAPGAYKDIDEVVRVSHEAKIGNLVARVKPIGVIKG